MKQQIERGDEVPSGHQSLSFEKCLKEEKLPLGGVTFIEIAEVWRQSCKHIKMLEWALECAEEAIPEQPETTKTFDELIEEWNDSTTYHNSPEQYVYDYFTGKL
jgi:hypothetical protein